MAKRKKTSKKKVDTLNLIKVPRGEFIKGIVLMILCTLFTSSGQIFLKAGMNRFAFDFLKLITNYHLIIGCVFYGLGLILFTGALKRLDLSLAYPFLSLSFIWVAIASYLFLGEQLAFMEMVGIFVVLLGVIFVGLGERK